MACRINPAIPNFFLGAGVTIFVTLILLVAVGLYIGLSAWILQTIVHRFELYEFLAIFQSSNPNNVYPTLFDYEFSVRTTFVIITTISISAIGLLTAAIITETKQSYYWKKRDLEYKFQGQKIPWYRVLISYIIICDGIKK